MPWKIRPALIQSPDDLPGAAGMTCRLRLEKNTLAIGDGRYRIVVLPGVETIRPETLRKLEEFGRAGGAVIATRRLPDRAPGFRATDQEHDTVRTIAARLFRAPVPDTEVGAALRKSLVPDVALGVRIPEIGFIHRTTPDAEIYFIANTSNQRQNTTAAFRVPPGRQAEWWDAITGTIMPAAVTERREQTVTIRRNSGAVAHSSIFRRS